MTTATLATRQSDDGDGGAAPAQPRRAGRPAHGGAVLGAAGDGTGDREHRAWPRGLHEARRLRQAGDVEGALAILAGTDTTKAEPHQARWAFAEWTDLVRRRFGDRDALVYSQGHGQGCRPGAPTDDGGDAGGRGGAGDALGAGQGRLSAQPAGSAALGEGLPSALTGQWPGAVVAQAMVDDP